ncbi:MAG TPA: porin [Myxococcales bacterium]|nr:porin [Myxococcales bacterium]
MAGSLALTLIVSTVWGQTAPAAPAAPAQVAPDLAPAPPSWYVLGNQDSASRLRIGGLVQFDGRSYFDDPTGALVDGFVIRRARPILAATLTNLVEFFLMPDFAGGTLNLYDAYVDLRPWSWLALRGGKFKTPFGLERLEDDRDLVFLERGLTADIDPDRDLGVALHGNLGVVHRAVDQERPTAEDVETLHYELAVLNGAPDGASDNGATNDAKNLVARVFAVPFAKARSDALRGIGLGIAGSYGREQGTATATNLPTFATAGQNAFFSYLPGVIAYGYRSRLTPELYYEVGSFGLLGEYVVSQTSVTTWAKSATLTDQAWQAQASYLLTGEHATFGGVQPRRPFNLSRHGYGAFQIAVRYDELLVDPATFPTFADPTKSANRATEFAGELNWYLTYDFRFGALFARTNFDGGAPVPGNRPSENALIGRLQAAF